MVIMLPSPELEEPPSGQSHNLLKKIKFSTDLLMLFFYSSFNLSVEPLHGIPVSYCVSYGPLILFSKVSSASLICQSGSFELPALMVCTGFALLPRSTMDTASEPGVRGTSFRAIPQSIVNQLCMGFPFPWEVIWTDSTTFKPALVRLDSVKVGLC